MTVHYFIDKFGITVAVQKLVLSFIWTVVSVGVAYGARRLELIGTQEMVAIAVAIRTLISGVFSYLKTTGTIEETQKLG